MSKLRGPFRWILTGLVIGLGIYGLSNYQKERAVPSPVLSIEVPSAAPTPRPEPLTQISPDGKMTVKLISLGEVTRILVNEKRIATKEAAEGELLVPFNSWSPDDRYFFLQEKTAAGEEYLVMKASGESWADGEQTLPVAKLFREKYPEQTIVAVTGWASPTLLIINAKSEKEASVSYWLEVPSRSLIRLSSYFY